MPKKAKVLKLRKTRATPLSVLTRCAVALEEIRDSLKASTKTIVDEAGAVAPEPEAPANA